MPKILLWWKRHSFGAATLVVAILLLLLGKSCSSCSNTARSPFSNLLPQGTPLIVEGTPSEVLSFMRNMGIDEPSLGEGQDLTSLQCDRLLYAAVPPDNNGDFSSCKQLIMTTVNAIEEQWSSQQVYPDPSNVALPQCPYGGQFIYNTDGQIFTINCSGSDHQTMYSSINGLRERYSANAPLVFIAFQSNDPQWSEAAISKKHPDIKILASDPERTVALLEKVDNPLTIRYKRNASLYVRVLNESLSNFWDDLPISLPGDYTTITKNSETGIYSLRADLRLAEGESTPELPNVNACLDSLPHGNSRIAASTALLAQLNILPWAIEAQGEKAPQVFGVATNAPMNLSQLLPTMSSAFSGLTQAGFVAQFLDASSAQQGVQNSPWGDLSNSDNPQCAAVIQENIANINIGDKLPDNSGIVMVLPQGPGPNQMGGKLAITSKSGDTRTYLFSGGLHKGKLWMEISRGEI